MITCQEKNLVETNVGQARDFQIKATREAFEILSSKLYSNKPLAIIRELSCNAQDSHVAAGNKEPIEVHLPSSIESYFSVKDNGTGLSENDINDLYTTYFGTNKNQSNDFTGCFGLGSKSPFCYTDSFTVISRYDGEKTTYICFKNEIGFPSVSKVSSEKTEECNGLEVVVPVKDYYAFVKEAKVFYEFFNPRPKILNKSFEFLDFNKILETDDFIFMKLNNSKYNEMQGVYVLMGNVVYKTNTSIHSIVNSDSYTLLLKANIGDVDITASRESLEYNKSNKTTAFILDKQEKAKKAIKNHIQTELDKCNSLHEARIFAIEHYFMFGNEINFKGKTYQKNPYLSPIRDFGKVRTAKSLSKIKPWKSLPNYNNILFIINDVDKYTLARLDKLSYQHNKRSPILFEYCDEVIDFLEKEEIPYFKLSEVDIEKEIKEKISIKRKKGIVYELCKNYNLNTTKPEFFTKLEDYDYDTNVGYYIIKDGNNLVLNGKIDHPANILTKAHAYKRLAKDETNLVAVCSKSENTLKKAGWKKLDDVISNFIKNKKPERRLNIVYSLNKIRNSMAISQKPESFMEDSVSHKFVSKVNELKKELDGNEDLYKTIYDYEPILISEVIDLDKQFSKEYDDIIRNISSYNTTFIVKVINLQDFYKNTEKKNES